MRGLGVDAEWIEAALADPHDHQDPVAEARRVLKKKFGPSEPSEWRERQKRYAFLLRRGFEPEVIAEALGVWD
ncbi:MAG: RecX family transcriptional regulator [Magnetococcales bacterium]|nr:RecX family transcriptional regulator [Magnetococcales bacterium]